MSTGASCPLCGRTMGMRGKNLLYGHRVCKKCRNGFANRRQFAYVIDLIVAYFIEFSAGFALGILLAATRNATGISLRLAQLMLVGVFTAFMLTKDGFSGISPGKFVMGVKVVDRHTGGPIGFGASVMRNLPTLIPFAPIILGIQLIGGQRLGDGWARSKVIWRKYDDNEVFTDRPSAPRAEFAPVAAALAPVRETGNPYQAPRQ